MNTFLQKIKEYFIPHKENDYKPQFFCTKSVLFISAIIVFVFLISQIQYVVIKGGNMASVISSTLVDMTNENRIDSGVKVLKTNPVLTIAAQAKANDMAQKSYFAHTSPDGVTPWHWFEQAGYDFSYAGENLAVNFSDSNAVNQAWMDSPGHKANILNENFREIGIATAQGVYKGENTTFVVELFGTKAGKKIEENNLIVKKEITEKPIVIDSKTAKDDKEVAGASLETVSVNNMSIVVKNNSVTTPNENIIDNTKTSFVNRILTSPQTTLFYIYLIFTIVVTIAMILDTFIEIRRRHMKHSIYATLILILILSLLYIGKMYIFPDLLII